MHHPNNNQKKARAAVFLSNKIDFRAKNITRDKGSSFNNDKGANLSRRHADAKCLGT